MVFLFLKNGFSSFFFLLVLKNESAVAVPRKAKEDS